MACLDSSTKKAKCLLDHTTLLTRLSKSPHPCHSIRPATIVASQMEDSNTAHTYIFTKLLHMRFNSTLLYCE